MTDTAALDGSGSDALFARLAALEARLATAEAALAERTADPAGQPGPAARLPDRRGMLRLAGGAAVGVAAGLAGAGRPAAANDGDALVLGTLAGNDSFSVTGITTDIATAPGVVGFGVIDRALPAFPGTAAVAGHSNGRFGNALFGYHQGTGNGVCGQVDGADGIGVLGYAPAGVGGVLQGGRANVALPPGGLPPLLRTDAHSEGELILDADGNLWLCLESGSPGRWRLVAGQAPPPVLRPLDPPVRVYDSRAGLAPLNVQKGAFGVDEERDLPLGPTGLTYPDGTVLFVNITVTGTGPAGWLSVFRYGQLWPGTSTVNWSAPNQTVANMALLPVVSDYLRVRTSQPTHVVADVIAFTTPRIIIDSD